MKEAVTLKMKLAPPQPEVQVEEAYPSAEETAKTKTATTPP